MILVSLILLELYSCIFDFNDCRDIQNQYILCVGILLGSSWHLSARTLSGFGLLDQGVKGSVFTSLAAMAINFTHVFSIQHILRFW